MSTDTDPNRALQDIDPDKLRAAMTGLLPSYWAERQPDRLAISSAVGDLSFFELNARSNQLVRAFRARGLVAGDAVALMCSNRPEFAEVMAATRRAGLRLTTVNWHLTSDEAAYIVDDCEAKAFVADARFADTAASAARNAPKASARLAVGGDVEGFEAYESALEGEATHDIDDPSPGTSMLYTSGTTGRPKGVYRPPTAVATSAGAIAGGYQAGSDLHLTTGPLYHAAPLAFSLALPLAQGVGCVLMDGWNAAETLHLVSKHRITHTHMVPTMFHRLLSLPDDVRARHDISSLRFVIHGAAPCPVVVKQRMIEWLGPILWEYYAATEGMGAVVDSKQWLEKPGTVGRPDDPEHCQIRNDDGELLSTGEIGSIFLKAPEGGRFTYYKDEAKTDATYRGDYFTLGDVGYLDEDGFLYLTDRSSNLIISGGVNIYPAEAEAELLSHPSVGDVAVIGVENTEWGEEVKAVVELHGGYTASPSLEQELIAHCRERLTHFKCPRSVDFIERLPRHDNGKLYKRALRETYRRTD